MKIIHFTKGKDMDSFIPIPPTLRRRRSSLLFGPNFNLLDFVDKLCRNSNIENDSVSRSKQSLNKYFLLHLLRILVCT